MDQNYILVLCLKLHRVRENHGLIVNFQQNRQRSVRSGICTFWGGFSLGILLIGLLKRIIKNREWGQRNEKWYTMEIIQAEDWFLYNNNMIKRVVCQKISIILGGCATLWWFLLAFLTKSDLPSKSSEYFFSGAGNWSRSSIIIWFGTTCWKALNQHFLLNIENSGPS